MVVRDKNKVVVVDFPVYVFKPLILKLTLLQLIRFPTVL